MTYLQHLHGLAAVIPDVLDGHWLLVGIAGAPPVRRAECGLFAHAHTRPALAMAGAPLRVGLDTHIWLLVLLLLRLRLEKVVGVGGEHGAEGEAQRQCRPLAPGLRAPPLRRLLGAAARTYADAKGYTVDVKGYHVDAKGYMVDIKGYRVETLDKGGLNPET
eukprot:1177107-Prorocentrum_minimum.AAC.3